MSDQSGYTDSWTYRIRTNCRLCGTPRDTMKPPALDLGSTPLANELLSSTALPQDLFPLYLVTCERCGHVQLPVVANPERLFCNYVYQSSTSETFTSHLKEFASTVKAREGAFVVEIGSNDGTLLKEYKARGCEVLGVDPASNIADIAENKNGVPTVRAFFGRETLANWNLVGRKADLILALNVFAHADDLGEIVEGVAGLLADDGRFVFEVGYLPSVIERGLYRVIYHEHLSYHHLAPLLPFFERYGLEVYDAERVNTQGGSVRVSVGWRDKRPRTADLVKLLAEEQKPGALDVGKLATRIKDDRESLRFELDEAQAAGKKVCGYGSPAQLVTTAYALGLSHSDIAYVCDDNPLKVGKYTPGLFWPIVPTSALYDGGASVCVIFSANFAGEIVNRHASWEGDWVIP